MGNKFLLLVWTWVISLAITIGLHIWGLEHPEPFVIRPFIVFGLLLGPSVILSFYLAFANSPSQT